MKDQPKRPRPFGRLAQLSKATRLRRRALGQWQAQPRAVRHSAVTRYSLEESAWRESL